MSYDQDIRNKVVKSRISMLIKQPFFGALALGLRLVERNSIGTAATDGTSYFYNKDFIAKLTEKQINFLTLHEVLHPALQHIWRRGDRDATIWNHACDYVINLMIVESDPNKEIFEFIQGGLLDIKYKGKGADEIYDILINDPDYVKKAKQQQKFQLGGSGSSGGPSGSGQGQVLDDHDVWNEKGGNPDGDEEGEEGSGGSIGKLTEQDWKHKVIAAAQAMESSGQGNVPGLFKRLIDELVNPQKDWRLLLNEFLSFEVNDYGFNPPDKRFSDSDFLLPDFSEMEDSIVEILFAVDISGSVGDKEFKTCYSEIVGCIDQFGGRVRGKLIYTDCVVKEENIYELDDILTSMPHGSGGTDFRPLFKWVDENMPDCKGVVFLTDTFGNFPDKEPNYPVLWVKTMKNSKVPWGLETELII